MLLANTLYIVGIFGIMWGFLSYKAGELIISPFDLFGLSMIYLTGLFMLTIKDLIDFMRKARPDYDE